MNALLITLLLIASPVEQPFQLLSYVVDRPVFEAMVEHLGLSESQASLAEVFWKDYLEEAYALEAASMARVEEVSRGRMREIEHEARMRGKEPPWDSEEMNRLHRAGAAVRAEAHRQGDVLVASFLGELESILNDDQRARVESLPRLIRRVVSMRHGRAPNTGERLQGGINLHIVIEDLARSADRVNPSFVAWILQTSPDTELSDEERAAFEAQLERILDEYDLAIDAVRIRSMHSARQSPAMNRTLLISQGSDRGKLMRQNAEARIENARRASGQILELIESAFGDPARDAWLDAFEKAIMPMFAPDRLPEWSMKWLRGCEQELEPEQLVRLQALYAQYAAAGRLRRSRILQTAYAAYYAVPRDGEEFSKPMETFLGTLWAWREEIEQFQAQFQAALPPNLQPIYSNAAFMAKAHHGATLRGPSLTIGEREFASGRPVEGLMPPRIDPRTGQYIGEWKHPSEVRDR